MQTRSQFVARIQDASLPVVSEVGNVAGNSSSGKDQLKSELEFE
jgi:hypothetical protein